MKIMITGAAGAIGMRLTQYLKKVNHHVIPVAFTPRENIISADLRDEATVFHLFKSHTPDLVIHLAALTNIRLCQQNPSASWETNYHITALLAEACSQHKTRIIFFSSDYVFGQYDHLWTEHDRPCPTTQYGKDKAAAEQIIQTTLSDYAIVRTAQLYGVPGDLISLVQSTLSSQPEFTAFANLVNCPTWIEDLLTMVNVIIQHGHQGIFHCVGPEALSRYQFACKIAQVLGLEVTRIKSLNLDFSNDVRPPTVRLSSALTCERLQCYPGRLEDHLASYYLSLMQEA